jgi:hypothetical protein
MPPRLMKKSSVIIAVILLATGGLAWLGLKWYTQRQVALPPITDQDRLRMEALAPPNAPAEPPAEASMPILPSQSVRLAIGGFGLSADSMNRQFADLLTLTPAIGLFTAPREAGDTTSGRMSEERLERSMWRAQGQIIQRIPRPGLSDLLKICAWSRSMNTDVGKCRARRATAAHLNT